MSFVQKSFYAIVIAIIFFSGFNLLARGEVFSISGFIILLLLYLPLFLAGLWLGITGLSVFLIVSLFIAYFDLSMFHIFMFIFFIPVVIIGIFTLYYKKIVNTGQIISILALYSAFVIVATFIYYKEFLSFTSLYDNIYFLILSINSQDGNLLKDVTNVDSVIETFVFFSPSILGILWLYWMLLNYQIVMMILRKNDDSQKFVVQRKYFPIRYYNALFVILMLITVAVHKFLANSLNIYYILYNVLLILLSSYLYLGMDMIWKYIGSKKSIVFSILFFMILIFMFMEGVILLSIIGFLVAMNIIKYKE